MRGYITDPKLTVVQQSSHSTLAANAGWGANQAALTAADNATGAFPLTNSSSLDSAVVISLPAVTGGYSATVGGGEDNSATNSFDTVSGGQNNVASDPLSVVTAGCGNLAGSGSVPSRPHRSRPRSAPRSSPRRSRARHSRP